MSERNRESLSAFMDGELEGDPTPVIDSLIRDESVRLKWMRYHLIADVMKHSTPEAFDRRFVSRLAARLETEPTVLCPTRRKAPAYLKPAAGVAIAASVAAMAIIGVQWQGREVQPELSAPAKTVAEAPAMMSAPAATPVGGGSAAARTVSDVLQPIQPNIPEMRQYTFPVRKVSADGTQSAAPPNPINSRLNNYLLNYNEYHAHAGMQGMLPYVRIVAHDNN
ncbi:MAG: sigma-E factor negative regulatory protein [Gammaproteobacteria bacterium]|jgi:sigma-E factor negative regulatory protein RseA